MKVSELFSGIKFDTRSLERSKYNKMLGLGSDWDDTLENDIGGPGELYDGAHISVEYDSNNEVTITVSNDSTISRKYNKIYAPNLGMGRYFMINMKNVYISDFFVKPLDKKNGTPGNVIIESGVRINRLYCMASDYNKFTWFFPKAVGVKELHVSSSTGVMAVHSILSRYKEKIVIGSDIKWITSKPLLIDEYGKELSRELTPESVSFDNKYIMEFNNSSCKIIRNDNKRLKSIKREELEKREGLLRYLMGIYLKQYLVDSGTSIEFED